MATPTVNDWRDLLKFRCTGCGNCCKETIVMLTDHDIRRIIDGTGKAPQEFIRFFGEGEITIAKRYPFWVRLATRRVIMALRWGRNRCIFLDKEDRCTIYEHRPVACREHPFNITLSDTGAVENLSLSKVSECLYELDGKIAKRTLRAVCKWNEDESEEYQERIKEWNRRRTEPKNRGAFMEFLGFDWNESGRKRRTERRSSADLPSFS